MMLRSQFQSTRESASPSSAGLGSGLVWGCSRSGLCSLPLLLPSPLSLSLLFPLPFLASSFLYIFAWHYILLSSVSLPSHLPDSSALWAARELSSTVSQVIISAVVDLRLRHFVSLSIQINAREGQETLSLT